MESSGTSLKIHISSDTYELLKKIGGFVCEKRGVTFIKVRRFITVQVAASDCIYVFIWFLG
jgi:hypothetical protein